MKTECQPRDLVDRKDIWKQIAVHPFLVGMNAHHLEMLARCATKKQFEAGEVILRAGEPANGFYLVEAGKVALEVWVTEHGPVATDIVDAGEPLGWSWLFPPYRWHFDARAIEPTLAIFFDGKILLQEDSEDLTLAHDLFKRMSEVMVHRLQATRRRLIEAVHKSRLQDNDIHESASSSCGNRDGATLDYAGI